MTIRQAITHGASCLKTAGIESSSLDASILLAHILNVSRSSLAANGTELISEETFDTFNALVKRRLNGECTACIIGKKEFFNLEFMVNGNVLIPRPDTEILVEKALKILGKMNNNGNIAYNTEPALSAQQATAAQSASVSKQLQVLDICTGSGAVAVSLKHEMPSLEVTAADISKEALVISKINAKRLLPESSQINFYCGDLFKALPKTHRRFSLIVSNPPYIPSGEIKTLSIEVQNEPHLALDGGKSGLKIIEQIIKKSPFFLEQSGALLLEADPRQMEKIAILLEKRGFRNIELYKDLSGQERVIGGVFCRKNKMFRQ